LSPRERLSISLSVEHQIGTCYGFTKIFTHLLDALISKIAKKDICFFRGANHTKYPICSYLWAKAYYQYAGYKFNEMDYWEVSPDDMHDHILNHPEEWELVVSYG
jgi:hypothetical protein